MEEEIRNEGREEEDVVRVGEGKERSGLLSDSRKEVGVEGGSLAAREGKINKQSRRGSDSSWHQARAGPHIALSTGW